mmetsp:Transcript_36892/g.94001  ORF Transcript_36892/g.94001 Transcript_36892/m.94001 type:complete len:210 (-) Transcript_36892:110-739(-)
MGGHRAAALEAVLALRGRGLCRGWPGGTGRGALAARPAARAALRAALREPRLPAVAAGMHPAGAALGGQGGGEAVSARLGLHRGCTGGSHRARLRGSGRDFDTRSSWNRGSVGKRGDRRLRELLGCGRRQERDRRGARGVPGDRRRGAPRQRPRCAEYAFVGDAGCSDLALCQVCQPGRAVLARRHLGMLSRGCARGVFWRGGRGRGGL